MSKPRGPKPTKTPTTRATLVLRGADVDFEEVLFDPERESGRESLKALGIDPHAVIKTYVYQTNANQQFLLLMHLDKTVDSKRLAREVNEPMVARCHPSLAEGLMGYPVAGMSPFGTKQTVATYAEASVFMLDEIYLFGGKPGLLFKLRSEILTELLDPTWVEVSA